MARAVESQPREEILTMETSVTALQEVGRAGQMLPGDRYHLKPPIVEDDSDIEQFIWEFEDVVTITNWPAPVQILQLQTCLMGRANSNRL